MRPGARSVARALVALALLGACKQIGLQDRPMPLHKEEVVTTSGVRYTDLFLGQGPAAGPGDEMRLDYTVWLENGTRVFSTLDGGQDITLKIGAATIPGLDDGLLRMQPDGRRRVVVPAALAYGERGVEGLIPPNANLVFEVHAIEVRPAR